MSQELVDILGDFAALAADACDSPLALILLNKNHEELFASSSHLEGNIPIRSFLEQTLKKEGLFSISDINENQRFKNHPLLTANSNLRSYSGTTFTGPDNFRGVLVVASEVPRSFGEREHKILQRVVRQIMQRLILHNALAHSKRMETFFQHSFDLHVIASKEGFFIELNQAWENLLGYPLQELKHHPFLHYVHPEDVQTTTEALQDREEHGHDLINFEIRFIHHDGSFRWLQWMATMGENNQVFYATARDITKHRKQEQELHLAKVEAEQANKAKGVFLANMSHELRTPLNSVIGFANILLKNKQNNLDTRQLNYLGRIVSNGLHLLSLLNDILDLSKVEVGKLDFEYTDVNIVDLIETVVGEAEGTALARSSVLLTSELPDFAPIIRADRRRLRQVLHNLVSNAVKFSPDGQVLVRLVTNANHDAERIDIIDSGIGIAPEDLQKVFQAFEQVDKSTSRRFEGTGLGLAISKSLAEEMGFRMTVSSIQHEGSTFSVLFDPALTAPEHIPRPIFHARAPSTVEIIAEAEAIRSGMVLIIDDDPESRLIMETVVEEIGLSVISVNSVANGIAIALQRSPDIVLLDLMLPNIDGFQALEVFRTHPVLKDIPIVIISIIGTENRTKIIGATDILDKPVSTQELERTISKIISHGI